MQFNNQQSPEPPYGSPHTCRKCRQKKQILVGSSWNTVKNNYTYSADFKYMSIVIDQYCYVSVQGPFNQCDPWEGGENRQKK